MGWDWYTYPMYDSCSYTRECQTLMQQEEAGFSGGPSMLVCHFVGGHISHDLS